MFRAMRVTILILGLLAVWIPAVPAAPPPESVAVLYNSAVADSKRLAEFYRNARGIPAENLIGLEMPDAADISREEYEARIAAPLRAEFERRGWWQRGRDQEGVVLPVANRIRILVTMRGVPLRIMPTENSTPPIPDANSPVQDPVSGRDEASVDSELAMFGVEGVPTGGVLQNRYHMSDRKIGEEELPFMVLTARIDGPSHAICERMISDAVATEKTGLWGMSYVDIANKFPQGDEWLEGVVKANLQAGIPTVVDRFDQTLPKHYPMTEAALYHGWYNRNVNGPFLNPRFKFRRGAVAMHLHSFSAEQLSSAGRNWCAPLLARGAAATVGNVYEPYLHLTHDFDLLHRRLLEGFSWVEACWMAMPVTSWQGVVLGDPLYRPFLHLSGTGTIEDEDRNFRALRTAMLQWPDDREERWSKLENAARQTRSGIFAEALGLELLETGMTTRAVTSFRAAKTLFVRAEDKLRQDFHIAAIDRTAGRNDIALRTLRDAQVRKTGLPESEAIDEWVRILDPPPPPAPAGQPQQ